MTLTIDKYGNLNWVNESNLLHREKGPASIAISGHISYCVNGGFHRLDGPAIIWPNCLKFYYIYDNPYTKKEYWSHVKRL